MQAPDFKMLRRNSLRVEVDGVFPGFDEEEDTVVPTRVTMNECQMLKRVLGGDKQDVLPKSCRTSTQATQNKSFMSRLAHVADSPDIAGRVSLSECHNLSDTLKMMPGGSTFLPFSCNAMINHEQKIMSDQFEQQNAKVYKNLKRRTTWVAKEDYPPSCT
jgi:hypothetical protein